MRKKLNSDKSTWFSQKMKIKSQMIQKRITNKGR